MQESHGNIRWPVKQVKISNAVRKPALLIRGANTRHPKRGFRLAG